MSHKSFVLSISPSLHLSTFCRHDFVENVAPVVMCEISNSTTYEARVFGITIASLSWEVSEETVFSEALEEIIIGPKESFVLGFCMRSNGTSESIQYSSSRGLVTDNDGLFFLSHFAPPVHSQSFHLCVSSQFDEIKCDHFLLNCSASQSEHVKTSHFQVSFDFTRTVSHRFDSKSYSFFSFLSD